MSTITITENHPNWTLYNRLRKCGEVTASPDGRHFGLNCIHCPTIFPWTNIKDLLGHLHEKHATELRTSAHGHERQQQQHERLKAKKSKLCAASSLPVQAVRDASDRVSNCKQDPLESTDISTAFAKAESPCSTERECRDIVYEEVVENQSEVVVQSFSDPEDDEAASETHSKNSSENEEDDFPDYKLDLCSHENREVLSYIIEMHQENSILWDKEHAFYQKFHMKLKICNQMIRNIQSRFGITLTYTNIREAFAGLRKLYTEELLYGTEAQTSRLWCFEKLEFLRSREIADNAELVIPIEQLIPLADIYQRHPVLWNLNRDESHNRVLQKAEQQQMLHEVNAELGLNMTLKQFRQRLLRMRRYLRNDRRKRLKCEQEGGSEAFEPQHEQLYQKLQYLEPFIGPHRCDKCGELILQFHAFKAHLAAHEGRLPYTCSHCAKGFKHFGMLEIHLRRHTGEKPFACTYCEMRFAAATDLRTHASLHGSDRPYICHICGLAFRSNSLLYNHNSAVHASTRFQCPQCPKSYAKKDLLNTHLNSHAQLRCAECHVCGKGFFSRKTLRQHMQLHDEVLRFQCEVCDKKFAQLSGLCAHRRSQHKIAGARSSDHQLPA